MAKDDYHVIVYQILAYLYGCLKSGKAVDPKKLSTDSVYFKVNKQQLNELYWAYIIYHLQKDGLIEGVVLVDIDNVQYPYPADLSNCMITPKGIEYLTDNSFIAKAKEYAKDLLSIIPFD